VNTSGTSVRCLTWALLAGSSALLLVLGLSLLLSNSSVLAQPVLDVTDAALEVQKYVSKGFVAPGDTLLYTITVRNGGDASAGVWITDELSSDLLCIPGSLSSNYGTAVIAGGVITWNESIGVEQTARIWFSAEVLSGTTASEIENTAQVTGTGELITKSVKTTVLTGQPPNSQIRSPDKDQIITQKGTFTITGIAWGEGVEPPYLIDDPVLTVQRQGDRSYYVSWTEVVSAQNYTLQEAQQPDFSDQESTVLGASTTNQLISKSSSEDGTYYYRVQASRLGMQPSRWSNVEQVNVPWTATSGPSLESGLSTGVATNSVLTVQVRIDDSDWQNATTTAAAGWDGRDWSYAWSLPEEREIQHTISTRASGEDGMWGPTDTVTVTLDNGETILYFPLLFKRWPAVPYAPTMNSISNPDQEENYAVSWSYSYTDISVLTYTLQEATDENFSDPTNYYPGNSTSYSFTDKDSGNYYYRVRGHNQYGAGNWSNVSGTTVRSYSYHYDFSSPTTVSNPWPVRRSSLYEGDVWGGTWTEEQQGSLFAVMNDKFDFAISSPMEVAPAPPYSIQTRVAIHDPANLVAYGIIFGANDGSPCPAYRASGCFYHYYRLEVIWDSSLKAGFKRIDQHESDKGKGQGTELAGYRYVGGDAGGWHIWRFEVKTDGIDVYYDGSLFSSTSDNTYVNDPYFGVYTSANEYKPSIGRFDYYYVDPQ
jgi:uncharacterized repeat protein (TIGR01451 family)